MYITVKIGYSGFHLCSNIPCCVLRRSAGISLKHNSLSYAKRNSVRSTENSNASEIRCSYSSTMVCQYWDNCLFTEQYTDYFTDMSQ